MFEYYPLIEWGYSNVTVPPSMLVSAYIHNLVQSSHNRGGEYQLILMFFHTYAILTYSNLSYRWHNIFLCPFEDLITNFYSKLECYLAFQARVKT